MKEYRLTRPGQYLNPGCPGHKNKSARQGYYVAAESAEEACRLLRDHMGPRWQFEMFDVQLWREDTWRKKGY